MKKTTVEQKLARLNEGTLCSIQTGFWGASAKYDKNKLGKDVPKDIVRAMQDLLDDKVLMDDIRNIQWQAKYLVKNNSLPFPIDENSSSEIIKSGMFANAQPVDTVRSAFVQIIARGAVSFDFIE